MYSSLSSIEAEFITAAEAEKMHTYLRFIPCELGFEQITPTIIYQDDMLGASFMTTSDQLTKRIR